MVGSAIRRGVRFDYLLVDSWFTCKELVHFVMRMQIKCHFLGMIKMGNTKYVSEEYGTLTAKGCIDKLKRVRKGNRYSRKQHCYYGGMQVILMGFPSSSSSAAGASVETGRGCPRPTLGWTSSGHMKSMP